MTLRSLAALALTFGLVACAANTPAPRTASTSITLSAAVLDTVCHAEHVDKTSQIFVAVDASGKPGRIEVTPSKTMADMGNLIFDLDGKLLGESTGGEFPWSDASAMKKEKARVDALMNGAAVPEGQTPQRCP